MEPNDKNPPSRPDPLIDEVRAVRKEVSDAQGNDVDRLIDHLQEVQRQFSNRVVRRPLAKKAGR
jgi:hypothetical protein